ncbi:MAG TPA: hypothetical protein VKY56_05365 [Chloroflexota bacterium]|nr:hypothetical protein [Chloroflexota bacterium]
MMYREPLLELFIFHQEQRMRGRRLELMRLRSAVAAPRRGPGVRFLSWLGDVLLAGGIRLKRCYGERPPAPAAEDDCSRRCAVCPWYLLEAVHGEE